MNTNGRYEKIEIYYKTRYPDTEESTPFALTEDKNAIVDDIDDYLSKFSHFTDEEIQPQKIELDMTIKLDFSHDYSHAVETNETYLYPDFNSGATQTQGATSLLYAVLYQDGQRFYFFIRHTDWLSSKAVKITLHMDVLNTFKLGHDYEFGGENIVKRQHFDRGYLTGTGRYMTFIRNYETCLWPESFEIPHYRSSVTPLWDGNISAGSGYTYSEGYSNDYGPYDIYFSKWYLIFMNQEDPEVVVDNPVQMYLLPDQPFRIEAPGDADDCVEIDSRTETSATRTYIIKVFSHDYNNSRSADAHIDICDYADNVLTSYTPGLQGDDAACYIIVRQYYYSSSRTQCVMSCFVNGLEVRDYSGKLDTSVINVVRPQGSSGDYYLAPKIKIYSGESSCQSLLYIPIDDSEWPLFTASATACAEIINSHIDDFKNAISRSFTNDYVTIGTIDKVDRTDTRIMKIIELPYCPKVTKAVPVSSGSSLRFNGYPAGFNVNELTFNIYNTKGKKSSTVDLYAFKASNSSTIELERELSLGSSDIDATSPYESLKYSLDAALISNTDTFSPENDIAIGLETKIHSSEFSYDLLVYDSFSALIAPEQIVAPDDEPDTWETKLKLDYKVTTTTNSRIFTRILVDYKNQSESYSGLMMIDRNNELPLYSSDYLNYIKTGYNYDVKNKNQQMIGNIINTGTGMFSAGKLINPASMAANAVKGVTGTVMNEIQAERDIQHKVDEKVMSTNQVAGSDDIDLLSAYNPHDKFMLAHFGPRKELQNLLMKLYQLTGYPCNIYGAPDMDSRSSFNYAQCEPDIEWSYIMDDAVTAELVAKWSAGVFKIHHVKDWRERDSWDMTFDTANYENSLLEYIDENY